MSEQKNDVELLEEIRDQLRLINNREESNELFAEPKASLQEAKKRSNEALNNITASLLRVHDKLFTFNNIMLAAFLGFSKYPSEDPIFELWSFMLPILNLGFLIYFEVKQMGLNRHRSLEMKWVDADRDKFGKMIQRQNLRSLCIIVYTLGIFSYLVIMLALN